MKYITKIPEEDREYTEELLSSGWKRLKEPRSVHLTMLVAFPIGLALTVITIYFYSFLYNPFEEIFNGGLFFYAGIWDLVLFSLSLFIFFIVHELIHLAFMPDFLHSEKTYWGMRWTYFFALSEEEMSKRRVITVCLMPLAILSGVLPVILYMLGKFNLFWWLLCLINASSSYVDVFCVLLFAFQVPGKGIVKNNGYASFYKGGGNSETS